MQAETDSDSIVQLRVSVARMEGMLSQALTDQSTRLNKAEAELVVVNTRLNDKGKMLAAHNERISSNSDRIHDLEEAKDGGTARVVSVLAVIIAGATAIFQFLPWP